MANGWKVDGTKVLERVRSERDRFTGFVVESTEGLPADQRLLGRARFTGPTTLEVDSHTRVDAKSIVIATGSSPVIPPPFDAIREHVLINDDIFELQDLPQSMAVIGTGIIGLELGQALHRLGVKIVFFTPFEELGPFTDPAVKIVTREILSTELDLQLQSEMLDATPVPLAGANLCASLSAGKDLGSLCTSLLEAGGVGSEYGPTIA